MAFDGPSARATSVADWAVSTVARASKPMTVARVGPDAMAFTAGVRKLLGPLSRSVYVVPWLTPVLVASPVAFMLINGILEVGFGAATVADRYIAPASTVAAVSPPTTCLYLAVVLVVEGGLFGDVLVRDIGLAGLTWAVLIDSLQRPTRTP